MATQLKQRSRLTRLHRIRALFPEARRLARRRRRRYAALVIVACGAAAVAGALIPGSGSGPPRRADDGRIGVGVSSITLPTAGDYFSLATVNGHLLVSGGPDGPLFPSGTTTLVHGRAQGTCTAAIVNPVTLRLGSAARGNCGDPALYGERVMAISSLARGIPTGGGAGAFAVRIARADPTARDGYRLGPIVMTYPQCSDCGAEWIYGDGSLWLYDNVTTFRSHAGQLLRISATTGAVLQRWRVPGFTRVLLAADADGLWFAPSNESSMGPGLHPTPAQQRAYQSLYRVTPGSPPVAVLDVRTAFSLIASDHTVWVDAGDQRDAVQRWRLHGSPTKATLLGRYPSNQLRGAEYGAGLPTYAGNAAIGIDFVVNQTGRQRIIRLSPDTATQRTVATVNAPARISPFSTPPPAVALGDAFYFLDPPTLTYHGGGQAATVSGAAVLYRVTPPPPGPGRPGRGR
ncbi:MAG TPA: hypothetical protein VMF14_06110 [Solirubrobacteraceae bacterium]|nr:hypothetical protein [Solirubrobacteraceae bacterium]